MIETRIAVGNSVLRELLNIISNSPLQRRGHGVSGIFEWSVHAIASVLRHKCAGRGIVDEAACACK